jgi:xylulokinase
VSSVIDERQYLRRERVGACYGDTVLAARAIGEDVDVDNWNPVVDEVAPVQEWRDVYEERWPLYHRLRRATIDISHVLAHDDQ